MSKTIEHIEDRIQFYKTTKVKYEKECIKHPNEKVYEDAVKTCEELIQINEQIKCELEAWEVVKEDIIYQETIPCEERPEYTYEFKKWTFEINEDQDDFEEKSTKLKKALEV